MYQTFTDPQRLAAFTRAPPRVFEGAKPGGKFAIFDGNVTGEYVTLEAPKKIVQRWRLAQWPSDHYSTQEIVFDQNDVDRVTNMRVTWSGVPVGQEEVVQRNWEGYYVRSIKQTFGYVKMALHVSYSTDSSTASEPFYNLLLDCLRVGDFKMHWRWSQNGDGLLSKPPSIRKADDQSVPLYERYEECQQFSRFMIPMSSLCELCFCRVLVSLGNGKYIARIPG